MGNDVGAISKNEWSDVGYSGYQGKLEPDKGGDVNEMNGGGQLRNIRVTFAHERTGNKLVRSMVANGIQNFA